MQPEPRTRLEREQSSQLERVEPLKLTRNHRGGSRADLGLITRRDETVLNLSPGDHWHDSNFKLNLLESGAVRPGSDSSMQYARRASHSVSCTGLYLVPSGPGGGRETKWQTIIT